MTDMEFPAPTEGMILTHLLIVSDLEASCRFYRDVLGAKVVMEDGPCILKFENSWLILNVGGGPTDDKPAVIMTAPEDPNRVSSSLNIRVADIQATYQDFKERGAEFLTPPMDRGVELRCYMRDPDGHLIEIGQLVQTPAA